MPPAAKRARSGARGGARGSGRGARGGRGRGRGAGASARGPTAAECDRLAQRLPTESAHALLAQLMASSAEAHAMVEAEVARHEAEPVDLRVYQRKASDILYSLEGLRPSQVFMHCDEVKDRLAKLVEESTKKLSSTKAFAALVAIMETVESGAEGEVRNGVLGCGGIDGDIATALMSLAEDMSPAEKTSVSGDVDDLEHVVEALDDFGCGYGLKEVVEQMRGD
eukprot:g9593.t1